MRNTFKIASVLPATAAGVLLLIAGLNHLAFPARVPYFEHVRRNASTPAYAVEVVRVNRIILEWQDYNRKWWIDWAIPDGWNDLPLIETGNDLANRTPIHR